MPTIGATLRASARRVPDAPALTFGDRNYSYRELDTAVDRVAGVLARHGVGKGDRLALMATNSDRFVITFYAAVRLGAIFVPVNPASAAPELRYLLEDSWRGAARVRPRTGRHRADRHRAGAARDHPARAGPRRVPRSS